MRPLCYSLLLGFLASASATAQQQTGCIGRSGIPLDSLHAQARRLHPEIMKPENQSNTVVVALVYDNRCTIVRHTMGRIAAQGGIESVLSAVFPDSSRLTMTSFETSGFAALTPGRGAVTTSPTIAWALLTPRGIPR